MDTCKVRAEVRSIANIREVSVRYSGSSMLYDTNSQVLDVEVDRLSQQVQQRTALERTVILLFLTMKSLFLTVTVFVKKPKVYIIMKSDTTTYCEFHVELYLLHGDKISFSVSYNPDSVTNLIKIKYSFQSSPR